MRALFAALLISAVSPVFAADTGRTAPPLTILRLGSPSLELSQYRGKVVALTFIYTTCPHCQELTRVLEPVAKDYMPRGVVFLECAFNDDAQQLLPAFLAQFHPAFPVGYANRSAVYGFLQRSIMDNRPLYVPHMVLIDRRGIIRSDIPGESTFFTKAAENIRVELDKLLQAPATSKK